MVLTDLPFDRCKLLHNRYDLIIRPDSAPVTFKEEKNDIAEESKEYAAFLKAQERKVGPSGFLDSNRYSYTFTLKKDAKPKTPRPKTRYESIPDNVVLFSARVHQDEKEYKKNMKVIEDHMWQHKQEERELKRVEGDIIKNQRAVRHTLRDYENAVNKKRLSEEKKLNQSLERFTQMSREHVHRNEEENKERTLHKIASLQVQRGGTRRQILRLSELERQYQAKRAAMELKRSEVMRMSQEFEAKLRNKEMEQHRLKQELADLAITLNMEAQKARVHKFEYERSGVKVEVRIILTKFNYTNFFFLLQLHLKSDSDIKNSLMAKNQLDADLALTKSHLDIKKRDEQRHLTDTQIQLDHNTQSQRKLNNSAGFANLDLKSKQMDQKVEAHNVRRVRRLSQHLKEKKEKVSLQQEVWEQRFRERQLEAQRNRHEDHLLFFQRMVNKEEEQEQMLYKNVRNAEYLRQKQEHTVRRLQQGLAEIKRLNAIKIKEDVVDRQKSEEALKQKLLKEKSELDKVHAQREESYLRLQEHRLRLREDKHLLQEHATEHQRLLKVGTRSDTIGGHF
ncbi:unnamed protein product [Lymnaea stagnalis]|uniref:Uncharacterized protein n=1 Tax=Lymnaea stagnalis TaxID=6523 RepID=A0AAV2I4F3_LYMST